MSKRKYGLIIGSAKPVYFKNIKARSKITRKLKNKVTYSTFSK